MGEPPNLQYETLQIPPIPKRLLVVGAPRSGTHFIAEFLQGFGMRVAHERMGEDGTVNSSWLAMRAVNDPVIKVIGRQNYDFEKMLHLVRHPFQCIPSMSLHVTAHFWDWQERHSRLKVDDPEDLEKIAAFWVFWTDGCTHLCGQNVLRLEDIASLGKPAGVGKTRREPIKLDDCGAMAEEVAKRMDVYGYKS